MNQSEYHKLFESWVSELSNMGIPVEDAEEIIQDIFLVIMDSSGEIRSDIKDLGAYMRRSCKNAAIDYEMAHIDDPTMIEYDDEHPELDKWESQRLDMIEKNRLERKEELKERERDRKRKYREKLKK